MLAWCVLNVSSEINSLFWRKTHWYKPWNRNICLVKVTSASQGHLNCDTLRNFGYIFYYQNNISTHPSYSLGQFLTRFCFAVTRQLQKRCCCYVDAERWTCAPTFGSTYQFMRSGRNKITNSNIAQFFSCCHLNSFLHFSSRSTALIVTRNLSLQICVHTNRNMLHKHVYLWKSPQELWTCSAFIFKYTCANRKLEGNFNALTSSSSSSSSPKKSQSHHKIMQNCVISVCQELNMWCAEGSACKCSIHYHLCP